MRRHIHLHACLLAAIVLLSWWGEGAAFLVLYGVLLILAALAIGVLHAIARLRRGPAAPDALLPARATRWVLNGVWVVIAGAVIVGLGAGMIARFSEPIGSFPGGALSGEAASAIPDDWSFLDEFEMIQIEVAPDAPRSVNVHSFVMDGRLYAGADFYFPFKRWVHEATRDPRVRVRARGRLYPMRAVRISDPEEFAALMRELERRLALWRGLDPETTPGFQTEVWLFRLEPRG